MENKKLSLPAVKMLDLIEYFSTADAGVTLSEIAKATGISNATLLRMLNVMVQSGYLVKTAEKQYFSCFKLQKGYSLDPELELQLDPILEELADKAQQTVEVITISGENLFWCKKKDPENQHLKITAHPGFKRPLYELDSPSRLFLKYLGKTKISRELSTSSFYNTSYSKCNWDQAWEIINQTDLDDVIFDSQGNANGIRRYSTMIRDKEGNFKCILSIAEAAIPINNTEEHITHIKTILENCRKKIRA